MIGRVKATTALWWFCCIVMASMFVEAITRIFMIGVTIASGWWLIRKITGWLFSKRETSQNLSAENASLVVPTHVEFRNL